MSQRSLIYNNYSILNCIKVLYFSEYIQVELKWIIPIIDQIIIIFDYLFYYIVNQKGSSNAISHEYFELKSNFKVLNLVKLLDELLIFH